jgi:glucose-1-phosphate adenylyltransferase
VADSLLSNGVVVSGGYVRHSVLSPWVRVEPGAVVENSVLLENVMVGAGARVRNTILDKNVTVAPGASIGHDPVADSARGFDVSEKGILAVPKSESVT